MTDTDRSEHHTGHPVGRRVRRLDRAIEWAAYREFALVHGNWDGPDAKHDQGEDVATPRGTDSD